MSLKVFFEVVEIKTKVASLFPFLIGVLFSWTYFKELHIWYTLLFFVGMLLFDMTTTAINNYMDFEKAQSEEYKYQMNVIGREQLAPSKVRQLIFLMLGLSAIIGFLLSWLTGWMLLIMGGVMCLIGIFYTFGPIPLSRMPLGEIFSGVTMGLGIFAITIYINTVNQQVFFLTLDWQAGRFGLTGSLWGILAIFLASLPMVFTIANIMLANNLRDLETDIKNHRYTLVYYIGRKQGIWLFQGLMYSCYAVMALGLLTGVYRWPVLVIVATLPLIYKNLQAHKASLPHPRSFGYAIKNMILFNSVYALGLLLSVFI